MNLLRHSIDATTLSASHHERLKRSPSMRQGKKRGYTITALIIMFSLLVIITNL